MLLDISFILPVTLGFMKYNITSCAHHAQKDKSIGLSSVNERRGNDRAPSIAGRGSDKERGKGPREEIRLSGKESVNEAQGENKGRKEVLDVQMRRLSRSRNQLQGQGEEQLDNPVL